MSNLNISFTLADFSTRYYGGDAFLLTGFAPVATPTGRIDGTMPTPILEMSVVKQDANTFDISIMPTVSMQMGNRVAAALPLPALNFRVTSSEMQRYEASMPAPTISFTITSPGRADFVLKLPSFSGAFAGRAGNQIRASITSFAGALSASVTTGSVVSISGRMPTPSVLATISAGGVVSFIGTLPAVAPGPSGRIAATLPLARVEISISGATATYEAYAVNLRHVPVPGKEPFDEVTRYTNYPFNQILRYKDQYYGVADSGIFQLTGATDNGTAVTWTWKTALEDDNVPEKKTVRSAYFSGRVGPAATITVFAGESGQNAYTYTTPRDTNPQNYRKVFGRGVKGKYYAIGATGAGVLELDTLDLEVDKMTRKI